MTIDRQTRKNLTEMFDILSKAFAHIEGLIDGGNAGAAIDLLSQCQESAVVIGTSIETACGEGTRTVALLEKLCEDIFAISQHVEGGVDEAISRLKETIDVFNEELPSVKEIVFLPCSPNLWLGFDYLYRQLVSDENCNVTVIPIPWYDKAPDGSIGGDTAHYETDGYPEYVKITHFNNYNIVGLHPDIIYIQNIFDDGNLGSSVHPAFYTVKLSELCDELVYIPPYIYVEPNVKSKDQLEKLREYLCLPGIKNVDKIIIQSENMKEAMIELLAGDEESEYRKSLEEKLIYGNHPRINTVQDTINVANDMSHSTGNIDIPHEWNSYILHDDGSRKKIILYSNSIPAMLDNSSKLINKISNSLEIFKQYSENIALIWRPHPMMLEVANQLRPEISSSIRELMEYFTNADIGIIDTNPDPTTSIALADAYYGDPNSVMELFKLTNKPIMIENPDVI